MTTARSTGASSGAWSPGMAPATRSAWARASKPGTTEPGCAQPPWPMPPNIPRHQPNGKHHHPPPPLPPPPPTPPPPPATAEGSAEVIDSAAISASADIIDSADWPLWEVFVRSKAGLEHRHCGSLHASDARMALQLARDVYTRRQEGCSVWVVRSGQIVASDPGDKAMYFDPARDKVYRHPSFYRLPDAVEHM